MLEQQIENYFIEQPRRLVTLGRLLLELGAGLLIAGLFGRVATLAPDIIRVVGGEARPPQMLADLYPALPTWWVPETLIGCIPALIFVGVGLWLAATGRRLRRFLAR